MRIISIALALAFAANINDGAVAFLAGPDGNNDLMKSAVEKALLTDIKPLVDTDSGAFPPLRNQILGTEVPCMMEYWSRPDIHTFGNVGFGGALHAAMAPIATKIIDVKAYGGVDVRKNISHELRALVNKSGARVVDLCCGVGMSTRALESAFHDAESVVGVDTSPEMISMAKAISGHEKATRQAMTLSAKALNECLRETLGVSFKLIYMSILESISVIDSNPFPSSRKATQASYRQANAENTELPTLSHDLVTIMYGFHEVPMEGRARILIESRRLLRRGGHVAIVDICSSYTPSPAMLAGEPFVLEYQQNIESQLANLQGLKLSKRKSVVPGHVNLWLLKAT